MKLYGFTDDGEREVLILENQFIIDGYDIADTLLEGLPFIITVDNNNNITVSLTEYGEKYIQQFNREHWLEKAKLYANRIITYGDEVELTQELKSKYGVDGGYITP